MLRNCCPGVKWICSNRVLTHHKASLHLPGQASLQARGHIRGQTTAARAHFVLKTLAPTGTRIAVLSSAGTAPGKHLYNAGASPLLQTY